MNEQRGGASLLAANGVAVGQVSCRCQLPPEALPSHLIFAPTSSAPSRGRGELGEGGGLLDLWGWEEGTGERAHILSLPTLTVN